MPGHGHARPLGAFVDGEACTLDEAIAAAASRLRRSRRTVFAGLGCDIEGVRSVVRLARRAGGAIDHVAGTAYAHEIQVLRDAGLFLTTVSETKARADSVFILGPGAFRNEPELMQRICDRPPKLASPEASRRVIWLGSHNLGARHSLPEGALAIAMPSARMGSTLAALRARLAGRPVSSTSHAIRHLDTVAAWLRQAKFGVALWACGDLDALAIETLTGLVRDLNRSTRFACLPLSPDDNTAGVAMALTWLTGFPSHICFGRGGVEFDPWRFDAKRLAMSGEVDLALWISAFRDSWPGWASQVEVIALTCEGGGRAKRRAAIEIEVGRPGIDHDGIHVSAATGGLALHRAGARGSAPSVGEVLGKVEALLERPERVRR